MYASIGASLVLNELGEHLEFILLTRKEEDSAVELLAMVANLHADPRYRQKLGSTMNIGRPWLPGSACDRLLVSLPYPFGPALELCRVDGHVVRFLWLVPITPDEEYFLQREGQEALEQKFEEGGMDAIDPLRESVTPPNR